DACELLHHGSDDEQVHVDEVVHGTAREVFVRNVAASHDGDRAVGDEQLVVHPVIEPPDVEQRRDVFAGNALARATERVEQAYLHVRVRGQAAKHRVAA